LNSIPKRGVTKRKKSELLNTFGSDGARVIVPPPSSNTADCWRFYNDPAISQYLTNAFKMNAVKACTVTGQSTAMNAIRNELQVLYSSKSPAKGRHFTALEHKQIHDEAYRKAGCTSESAELWGWVIVDAAGFEAGGISVSLREWVVGLSIDIFGRCELPSSR
jgi:hypothetical protein